MLHRTAAIAATLLLMAAGPAPDACMRPAEKTAGQIRECLHTAGVEADKALNDTYQMALAALDPESQTLLRESQRQWVAFRALEVKAQEGPWQAKRNLVVKVEIILANVQAIVQRERELRVYLPG